MSALTDDQPQVPIDMALKDAHHAQATAEEIGVALPTLQLAESHLQAVKTQCGASGDSSAVYGIMRKANGLPFDN